MPCEFEQPQKKFGILHTKLKMPSSNHGFLFLQGLHIGLTDESVSCMK